MVTLLELRHLSFQNISIRIILKFKCYDESDSCFKGVGFASVYCIVLLILFVLYACTLSAMTK